MAYQAAPRRSGVPDLEGLGELNFFLDANRIYEELGSRKECQRLVDEDPKLLYENTLEMRLHKHDGKLKRCKVYIFNDYLIIGSERLRRRKKNGNEAGNEESTGMTTTSSSDSGVLIFGSDKMGESSVKESITEKDRHLDYDSDISYYELLQDQARQKEEEGVKDKRRYNLKMWIDLGKVKPKIVKTKEHQRWGIFIMYASKHQVEVAPGEFRYDVVVDEAQMWIDDENTAKTVLGIIQEAIDKKCLDLMAEIRRNRAEREIALEELKILESEMEKSGSDGFDTDGTLPKQETLGKTSVTDKKSMTSKSVSSGGTPVKPSTYASLSPAKKIAAKRRRARFNQKKEDMQIFRLKMAMTNGHLIKEGPKPGQMQRETQRRMYLRKIESEQQGIADHDENLDAQFVVNFRNAQLGFSLTTGRNIEPYVVRIMKDSLAHISGVTVGDRVIAVNDIEITKNDTYKHVIDTIKDQKELGNVRITFKRRQKNELARIRKEEEQKKALEESGEVKVIETKLATDEKPSQFIGKSKTLKLEKANIKLRRKTEKPGDKNQIQFTMRHNTKLRKFKRVKDFNEGFVGAYLTPGNFEHSYQHDKKEMFKLHERCDMMFDTLLHYATSKEEKSCLYSLREIYDSEFKYQKILSHLKLLQFQLAGARKNVICKDLKSGKPFCEHRRPKRYCTQESSTMENAVDNKTVKSIFLNLGPIIKINFCLWKNLQKQANVIFEKMEKQNSKVEIYELLQVFCNVFNEIAPYLQIYWEYCKRYTGACEKQKVLKKENTYFYELVRETEKKSKMKLPNLLARPIQRITRYHLLFTTLQKYLEKYIVVYKAENISKDKIEMLKATNKRLKVSCIHLTSLGTRVNSKVGKAALLDKMLDIFDEIGGKDKVDNLIVPHRRIISKTEICYEKSGEVEKNGVLYLFNDKLVVAARKSLTALPKSNLFSSPLRVMKMIGAGKKLSGGSSSISKKTSKKLSIEKKKKSSKKGSLRLSKNLSLRLSNTLTRKKTPKETATPTGQKTNDSKDSKSSQNIYYDVLLQIPLRDMGQLLTGKKKMDDDVTLASITAFFEVKTKTKAKSSKEKTEIHEFQCHFVDEALRDTVLESLRTLIDEDQMNRKELKRMTKLHKAKAQVGKANSNSKNAKKGSVQPVEFERADRKSVV